jgi:hypothetical protein
VPRWRRLLLISQGMNRFAQKLTEHSLPLRHAKTRMIVTPRMHGIHH